MRTSLFLLLLLLCSSITYPALAQTVGHKCVYNCDTEKQGVSSSKTQNAPNYFSKVGAAFIFGLKLMRAQAVGALINHELPSPKLNRYIWAVLCPQPVWYSNPVTGEPINKHFVAKCAAIYPNQHYGPGGNTNEPTPSPAPSATPKPKPAVTPSPKMHLGLSGGYLVSRKFCINSVLSNSPNCNTMSGGHMTVRNGFLSGDDTTLTGNVNSDGAFVGRYDDQQGVAFVVTGAFSDIAPFQLRKQPILPDNQSGINITWILQKQ